MTTTSVRTRRIASFQDLRVWQEGIELVKAAYALCAKLPREELYGLSAQLKRAALSIPSNIAEGHTRNHRAEYRQSVYVALGSLAELETQLRIAQELQFVDGSESTHFRMERVDRLRAMLITLARRLS